MSDTQSDDVGAIAKAIAEASAEHSAVVLELDEAILRVERFLNRLPTKFPVTASADDSTYAIKYDRHGQNWCLLFGKTISPGSATPSGDSHQWFRIEQCTLAQKDDAGRLLPKLLNSLRAQMARRTRQIKSTATTWSAIADSLSSHTEGA